MSDTEIGLVLSVFLACSVEAVEALTIVLAVGATRGWSSALGGVGAAIIALSAIVLALGPAIASLPIDMLRLVVGGLLLIVGLQWLGKAILRSAGLKAEHDELQTYEEEAETARAAGERHDGFDGYSFAISFKGVFLEGLEVAFIVLTFGANQHRVGLAAVAAGIAVLTVIVAGLATRAPLARVPENKLKLAVGVMLSSFGMFWGAEGAGTHWPGGEAALLVIIPGILVASTVIAGAMRRATMRGVGQPTSVERTTLPETRQVDKGRTTPVGVLLAVWELLVGDDWRTAIGVGLALALTALVADDGLAAWWVMPGAVLGLLALSIRCTAHETSRGG